MRLVGLLLLIALVSGCSVSETRSDSHSVDDPVLSLQPAVVALVNASSLTRTSSSVSSAEGSRSLEIGL